MIKQSILVLGIGVSLLLTPWNSESASAITMKMYWTDAHTGKIQRADLDGSNVETLVSGGSYRNGIVVDPSGRKIYWTVLHEDKIQCANLDGSNIEDLITILGSAPNLIALDPTAPKIYWTAHDTKKIQRANLDGSNIEDLITFPDAALTGIALDPANGKMYWADCYNYNGKIRRANLDGSNIEDLVTTGLSIPIGIALDLIDHKMYWTDQHRKKIQRANLDGSNIKDLITRLSHPLGIALELTGGKMYWVDAYAEKIQRANLDGSNIEDLVTTGLDYPVAITIAIPELIAPPVADADGPYSIYVGDALTLDASGSTDADDDIVSYMWDLDDDGSFETDAGGQEVFDVNYAYLESLGPIVGGPFVIHVQVTDSEQQSDTDTSTLTILAPPVIEAVVDIKPRSCPNPLNVKSKGVLPVAILGSATLDVTVIDAGSIFLNGVRNVRSGYEDVAGFIADANDCQCTALGPDGYLDLTLKFKTQDIVATLGEVNHDDVLDLQLDGVLYDETQIEGADCIVVRGKHKPFNRADINKDGVVDSADFAIIAENWLAGVE